MAALRCCRCKAHSFTNWHLFLFLACASCHGPCRAVSSVLCEHFCQPRLPCRAPGNVKTTANAQPSRTRMCAILTTYIRQHYLSVPIPAAQPIMARSKRDNRTAPKRRASSLSQRPGQAKELARHTRWGRCSDSTRPRTQVPGLARP